MVGRLVAAGVAVDKAATDDGSTPLFVAAQEGNEAVVGRLIAAGAAVDKARIGDGATRTRTRRMRTRRLMQDKLRYLLPGFVATLLLWPSCHKTK